MNELKKRITANEEFIAETKSKYYIDKFKFKKLKKEKEKLERNQVLGKFQN